MKSLLQIVVPGLLFPLSIACAGDFSFESGLLIGGSEHDWEARAVFAPPDLTAIDTIANDSSDEIRAFGRWYFDGLSDERGPLAQAGLVDRASYVELAYSRSEVIHGLEFFEAGTVVEPGLVVPDFETDSLDLSLRRVSEDSGWFGLAGLRYTDTDDALLIDNRTSLRLGVGKYLLDTTTLQFSMSRFDIDENNPTEYEIALTHLAPLRGQWYYAATLGYTRIERGYDAFDEAWRAGLSLYPARGLEFGFAVDVVDDYSPCFECVFSGDRYHGFASWFISPSEQLSLRLWLDEGRTEPVETPNGTRWDWRSEQLGLSLAFSVRF